MKKSCMWEACVFIGILGLLLAFLQRESLKEGMDDEESITILNSDKNLNFTDFTYPHSSKLSKILNGDRFVIELETTATDNKYPLSSAPLYFQSTVTGSQRQGISLGHGGSVNKYQIRMADGKCKENDKYCNKNMQNFHHDDQLVKPISFLYLYLLHI